MLTITQSMAFPIIISEERKPVWAPNALSWIPPK
uniref:Uncharacterized protein n=1 Tax=Salmonella phage PMBT18 TaxID=3229742 RepID=A0AB39C208_9CAUD